MVEEVSEVGGSKLGMCFVKWTKKAPIVLVQMVPRVKAKKQLKKKSFFSHRTMLSPISKYCSSSGTCPTQPNIVDFSFSYIAHSS